MQTFKISSQYYFYFLFPHLVAGEDNKSYDFTKRTLVFTLFMTSGLSFIKANIKCMGVAEILQKFRPPWSATKKILGCRTVKAVNFGPFLMKFHLSFLAAELFFVT